MRYTYHTLCLILVSSLFLIQCAKEEVQAKNMEQLYQEQGVPVRVRTLEPRLFEQTLSYNAAVSGIKESRVTATLGDTIDKVLVKVGDSVKKDQVVATFPMDNPNAQYFQAKVAYENAETLYKRTQNLLKTGGIAQQELDNARTAFEVAKANWEAVRQVVKVKAPISGYVTSVDVLPGDNVEAGDRLLTVSQVRRMRAKVWVGEKQICRVKPGQPAYLVWQDQRIEATVAQVDIAMNDEHQGFGVIVECDNPDKLLRCGTTAEVIIVVYRNPEALVLQRSEILAEAGKQFVFVAKKGNALRREISLGRGQGLELEVIAGLTAGDRLIYEGQQQLKTGAKLNIIQ